MLKIGDPGPTWNFVECSIGCNNAVHYRLSTGVAVRQTTHHTGWDAHHKDSLQNWNLIYFSFRLTLGQALSGQHEALEKLHGAVRLPKLNCPGQSTWPTG